MLKQVGQLEGGSIRRVAGDPSKAKRILGWEAGTPVDELCREMVASDLTLVEKGDLEN